MPPLLPSYTFRAGQPSFWDLARFGLKDPARIIPDSILQEISVAIDGPVRLAVVADPDLARHVLNEASPFFGRDRFVRRIFRRAWGQGLAAAEGEPWAIQRRAAAPAFRPDAIEKATSHFAAAGAWAVQAMPLEQAFDFGQWAPRIIARVLFPSLIGTKRDIDTDAAAADIAPYIAKIAEFSNTDLLPLPERWIDWLHGINRAPSVRRLRALAAKLATDDALQDSESMIARVSAVGPMEDNIRGLFPAAMDTTTMALSWSLWLLARHPEWQDIIVAEANTASNMTMKELPKARAVVQEAMRLYPPAPILVRSVTQHTDLGGIALNPGDSALVAIYAMHRHRDHWEYPDAFMPERFLGKAGVPDAYLPFGTGGRMCIAAQFAVAEVVGILATILLSVRLAVAEPEPEVSLIISCRSKTGWHVAATPRS